MKKETLARQAENVGLYFDTYSPGDGVARYRFFTKPLDYFAGSGIYTALGLKEAVAFVDAYCQGFAAGRAAERQEPYPRPTAEY